MKEKGKWIKETMFTKPYCSICGEDCPGIHGFSYNATKYCPNCGAEMEDFDGENELTKAMNEMLEERLNGGKGG